MYKILITMILVISGMVHASPPKDPLIEAHYFVECSIFFSVLATTASLSDNMRETLDGVAGGALVAAEMTLRNDGYREDYIAAAIPEWVKTRTSVYEASLLSGEKKEWLQIKAILCNKEMTDRQADLVNQWRRENGKKAP